MKNSSAILRILQSQEFIDLWGDKLSDHSTAKRLWETKDGGGVYSVTAMGNVIGFGAGRTADGFGGAIIIDDPIKPQDVYSEVIPLKTFENFKSVFPSRRNSKHTPIIIICQRLSEKDLIGYLKTEETEIEFEHFVLRALKEDDDNPEDKRELGEALWDFKYNKEDLIKMKNKSPYIYSGQYQQRPAPLEGNIVKRDWLEFYDYLPTNLKYYLSGDLAFSEDGASNSCLSLYGLSSPDIYLVKQVCSHVDFPTIIKQIKLFLDYNPTILIECKANGQAAIDTLRRNGIPKVVPINPKGSKEERLASVSDYYQAGNIKYPKNANFINEHISEILSFPNAKLDDRVDAESQAIAYIAKYGKVKYERFN